MSNSHDEIKKLLEASRKLLNNETINEDIRRQYGLLTEQGVDLTGDNVTQKINVAKSVEDTIDYETADDEGKSAAFVPVAPETVDEVSVGEIILVPYKRMSTPVVGAWSSWMRFDSDSSVAVVANSPLSLDRPKLLSFWSPVSFPWPKEKVIDSYPIARNDWPSWSI